MFTPTDALILLAISSPAAGCRIQEIHWRVDFLDRAVPAAEDIRTAVEQGLRSGLVGYSHERLFVSSTSRAKMLEVARATGDGQAPQAVAAWLNAEFTADARAAGFEFREQRDGNFRHGVASVEWRVLAGGAEVSEIDYIK